MEIIDLTYIDKKIQQVRSTHQTRCTNSRPLNISVQKAKE